MAASRSIVQGGNSCCPANFRKRMLDASVICSFSASVFVDITCQLRHVCFLLMLIGQGCRLSISSGRPERHADAMDSARGVFQSNACLRGDLYSIAHSMSKPMSKSLGSTLPSVKTVTVWSAIWLVMSCCRARRWTTRRSGAQCDPRQNRANGRGPGIRDEGQQRVDGQTLKITNWPLARRSLTYIL